MACLKRAVNPAREQARININLSASPTLSLSDPNAVLRLTLTLSIASAAEGREGTPLTFCTENTVFCEVRPGDRSIDVFARAGGTSLLSASGDRKKSIFLGSYRMMFIPSSNSPDLRGRGYRFVTIPGKGQGGGGGRGEGGEDGGTEGPSVVTLTHELDWDRIFRYEEKRSKEDLVPGERFKIGLARDFFIKGFLIKLWWQWGDLKTDLKDKKLHNWHEGRSDEERPDDDFLREGNWVLSEDLHSLSFYDMTEGGETSFEIVE